jgi:hypothetical protein
MFSEWKAAVYQKVLDGRPEEKRGNGRPRLRWLDDDVNDIRNMTVRQLKEKAKDRQEWTGTVREAKFKLKWIIQRRKVYVKSIYSSIKEYMYL